MTYCYDVGIFGFTDMWTIWKIQHICRNPNLDGTKLTKKVLKIRLEKLLKSENKICLKKYKNNVYKNKIQKLSLVWKCRMGLVLWAPNSIEMNKGDKRQRRVAYMIHRVMDWNYGLHDP